MYSNLTIKPIVISILIKRTLASNLSHFIVISQHVHLQYIKMIVSSFRRSPFFNSFRRSKPCSFINYIIIVIYTCFCCFSCFFLLPAYHLVMRRLTSAQDGAPLQAARAKV